VFSASDVEPVDGVTWDDFEDAAQFSAMLLEAKDFITSKRWCQAVLDMSVGIAEPGVVAVFLARLDVAAEADDVLWLVVGDLPPAYLVVDDTDSSRDALRTYISLMRDWVAAAGEQRDTSELIPVNVEANPANAEALATRLDLLESLLARGG